MCLLELTVPPLPNLLEAIYHITPGERARLLGELAKVVAAESPAATAGMLTDDNGVPVGLFLPVERNPPAPPLMTPEDRAELQRRLDTIDKTISTEELKAQIARGGVARSPGS